MWFKKAARVVSLLLVAAIAWGAFASARQVVSVTVRPLAGAPEVGDGIGGVPDWRLDVRAGWRWHRQETFADTEIGERLTWTLESSLPERSVERLRLMEDDAAGDDEIEEVAYDGASFEGPGFAYESEVALRPVAGLTWYVTHWPGVGLLVVLVLALILSVFTPWTVAEVALDAVGN